MTPQDLFPFPSTMGADELYSSSASSETIAYALSAISPSGISGPSWSSERAFAFSSAEMDGADKLMALLTDPSYRYDA
jgi:hypothetical protein